MQSDMVDNNTDESARCIVGSIEIVSTTPLPPKSTTIGPSTNVVEVDGEAEHSALERLDEPP